MAEQRMNSASLPLPLYIASYCCLPRLDRGHVNPVNSRESHHDEGTIETESDLLTWLLAANSGEPLHRHTYRKLASASQQRGAAQCPFVPRLQYMQEPVRLHVAAGDVSATPLTDNAHHRRRLRGLLRMQSPRRCGRRRGSGCCAGCRVTLCGRHDCWILRLHRSLLLQTDMPHFSSRHASLLVDGKSDRRWSNHGLPLSAAAVLQADVLTCRAQARCAQTPPHARLAAGQQLDLERRLGALQHTTVPARCSRRASPGPDARVCYGAT